MGRDLPRLLKTITPALDRPVKVALVKGRSNYVCQHKLEGGNVPGLLSLIGRTRNRQARGAGANCVEIRWRRSPNAMDSASSCQVNAWRNELLGKRLPTIDLPHGDLTRRE